MGIRSALGGAGLAVLGILIVEGLLAAGLRPLSPIGWPAGGMLVACALLGWPGALGGAVVALAYLAFNFGYPHRFETFFASPVLIVSWLAVMAALSVFLLTLHRRRHADMVSVQALRQAEQEARLAKQRLELALEGSGTALWDTNLDTGECVLSAAWSQMLGGPSGETRTTVQELMKLIHPDDLQAALNASKDALRGVTPSYAFEHRVRANDGRWVWVLSRGRVAERDPQTGRALRMIGTNIDITSRHQAEERMETLATHDSLTGVANRALLFERISRAVVRGRRSERRPALLYLDVDHFKEVNDRLGHVAGDAVLREFAARLMRLVRESDTVARIGGDEFVVLIEDVLEPEGARRVAEKIVAATRLPIQADTQPQRVTTSIGIALHDGVETADAWMKRADAALYEAKAAGRDTVRLAA